MNNILNCNMLIQELDTGLKTSMILPLWLDYHIFDELKANYCRTNSNMTVIDWDKSDVLNYLGTYFPRSYVEAYCIFEKYFEDNRTSFACKEVISIFDFGCGTGGEIIGLLSVLSELHENLKQINICVLDGNQHSLRLYENILSVFQSQTHLSINSRIIPVVIDDFYDLSILESVISTRFDIIITFKAICEFVTKQQFEQDNPYEHIAKTLLPKLENDGVMLIVDVTSFNDVSQEWLPQMMDTGLSNVGCNVIGKNSGYNQYFSISHSRKQNDLSKIAWRIIKNIK